MATKGETANIEVKKEVKVIKKQVKKENTVETTNGEQNGDTNVEAELTVKLPTKKSGAKIETKVEVERKILPDGAVEEVKTTTTKTTVDGKTEITTKTETRTLSKEEADEVVEVEEEEEEVEENGEEDTIEEPKVETKKTVTIIETPSNKETKENDPVIKKEERSETTTTKKVVIVQNTTNKEQESDEEEVEEEDEEELEETEPVTIIKESKTTTVKSDHIQTEQKQDLQQESLDKKEEEEEEVDEEEEEVIEEKINITEKSEPDTKAESEEIEEDYEEEEDTETKEIKEEIEEDIVEVHKNSEPKVEEKVVLLDKSESEDIEKPTQSEKQDDESEYTEEEIDSEQEDVPKTVVNQKLELTSTESEKQEEITEEKELKEKAPTENTTEKLEESHEKPPPQPEIIIPIKEPSVPLEKVEDIEIKPIRPDQDYLTKSYTESTEIKTSSNEKPISPLSTQTEYNRIENVVTVNRTTKTLDHSYEQLTQQGIPTVKTYFPPTRERVSVSPSKPYQPIYTPEPQTERRHSLLLERLSTERQLPTSDIYQNTYQYNNQNLEQQRQWSQEPQSEILTVSNVKPSTITNSQWYQQSKKENVIYNNTTSTTTDNSTPQWSQPQYQPQQHLPSKQPQTQQVYQPQPQLQSTIESITRDSSNITSNIYQQNSFPTYTPKPNWNSNVDTVPTANAPSGQYSYLNQDSSKTTQYSSSYVPPPWEQESSYVPDYNQNYYQAPSQPQLTPNTFSPSINQGWKSTNIPQQPKFTKPKPTSYVPPAPNQSFVKPVIVEPPNQPGRKTYYSEYERRYITVPESTYIPTETKFQPQPDPSPQYYYDNNEPAETVEHQWRKELREFTEKTSQTQYQTEQTFVKPPWEEDPKYAKTQTSTYTPTPTWSQTLRPRSWRERSFESEYVGSQEWPKSSTLGRGRPTSSYVKNVEAPIPERARGVSVDRYNPNNYQSPIPSEHPPVQSHTLTAPQAKTYHNPNVPAYHTRASAEPREQPVSHQQPRKRAESRTSPIQSRSFKYLQWITGTDY